MRSAIFDIGGAIFLVTQCQNAGHHPNRTLLSRDDRLSSVVSRLWDHICERQNNHGLRAARSTLQLRRPRTLYVDLHHDKHHQTYVTNLNNLIEDTDLKDASLEEIVEAAAKDPAKAGIFNNAGQHWNHQLFWRIMKKGGGGQPGGELAKRIDDAFGNFESFKEKFKTAGVTQFGSGWAWLALDGDTLKVTKTANADNPLTSGMIPILGIDVWEHAYYVDYENRRPEYLAAFLNHMVNWEEVEAELQKAIS